MSDQIAPTITAKPRFNALAQYLLALAVVVGTYSLYLKFAAPAIEGPPTVAGAFSKTHNAPFETESVDKKRLIGILPEDAWELAECKALLTTSGTILFQQSEPIDEFTLRVSPFTLVTGDGMQLLSPEAPPVESSQPPHVTAPMVLRCIEGAVLRFDKPIAEVFRGNAKMQTARLTGSVDIHRPATKADRSDAIDVWTSNIQIDKNRIHTLDRVMFSFGPHQGSGRNLLIDLAHESDLAGGADDFSNINGIRRLELAFLDRLKIEMSPQGEEWNVGDQPTQTNNREGDLFSGNQGPLEVSCSGPFVFDFDSQKASFQDNVVAQQMDGSENSLRCDQLTLFFDSPPGAHTDNSDPTLNSSLRLKQFVAIGTPAVVVSRSHPARITAEYLSYHLLTNQIDAHCAALSDRSVTLVSPDYEVVTKRMSYVLPDDGSIGPIQATGPGRLLRVANKKTDEFFLTWQQGLTSINDPDQPGLQKITVDGDARIRIANQTRVDADHLELFVWRLPVPPVAGSAPGKPKWEYRPAQLVTTGHVKIDSLRIAGSAEQLIAVWPTPTGQPLSQLRRPTPQRKPHRVAYRGNAFVQQPGGFTEQVSPPINPPPIQSPQDAPPAKKINFHSKRVNIRLSQNEQETQIQNLTLVGDVVVSESTQSLPPQLNAAPVTFQITGERLQMIPQPGDQNYRVLVSGETDSLAKIVGKDFELSGEKINLDQTANKLWVEGKGAMKIQASKQARNSPDQLSSNQFSENTPPQAAPENLDVQWNGGMIFNGSKIYFEDAVLLKSDQQADDGNHTNMRSFSQGLSVELKRPVNFQKLTRSENIGDPEIKELVFVDHVPDSKIVFKQIGHPVAAAPSDRPRPVVVKIQTTNANHERIEQIKISVPQVTVDPVTGIIQSEGPGTIATHRMGQPSSGKPSHSLGNLTTAGKESGISFIQINFDRMMNLDIHQKDMKIDGNVRTVYGPVRSWDATLDPDKLNSPLPDGVRLTSDHLRLSEWQPRNSEKPSKEIMAWGNVHLTSDSVEINADRVSYNQATDTLTIEGTPRTNANLWYKRFPSDPDRIHLNAEKITHRLYDQLTQTNNVKNLNFNGRK